MKEKQARHGTVGVALVVVLMTMGFAPQAQAAEAPDVAVAVQPQPFVDYRPPPGCEEEMPPLPQGPPQGQQDAKSDWTIGAIVENGCIVVQSPAMPAGIDAGVLFEPWTWGTTDLSTCSENDDKWGSVQVEFDLVDLLYEGRLPMGLFQSNLVVDIPDESFTSFQRYDAITAGPVEVLCSEMRAGAVTKGYMAGLAWVEEQLDGKDFDATGAIGYLPDASGDPMVVVEGDGFATITMDVSYADPFLEMGTQEWTIDTLLTSDEVQCSGGTTCELILKGHIDSVDAKAGVLAP